MSDSSGDLPDGWAVCTVEELAEPQGIAYGVLKPGPQSPSGVPMLRVSDVRNGQVETSAIYRISPELDAEFRRTKLRGGEVVISIQGSVGRVAVVPPELSGANVSRTLAMVRPKDPELARWIHRALEAPSAQAAIRRVMGGTTRDSLNLRDLRRLELPVAPEPVRSTVLELVELSSSKLTSSSAHLHAADQAVDRFRQAVLAAAYTGNLTANWRQQNPDRQRPIERRAPGSSKERAALQMFQNEQRPSLPDTWDWVPLAAVSDSLLGKMLDKAKNRGEPAPYLRNINVRWRSFDLSDVQSMPFEEGEAERFSLRSGDVLVCEGGEPGRCAVWRDDDIDMRFQKALHRVRCTSSLLPDWLVTVLEAHASAGRLVDYFTGTGISHLTGVSLARVPVPMPPVEEQREIARLVASLLESADVLAARIETTTGRLDRTMAAILAKAFRGQLLGIGEAQEVQDGTD